MPDTPIEAACRWCSNMKLTRFVKNIRIGVLCLAFFLMVLQDGLQKGMTGFAVSSIEPCDDPQQDRIFFFIQWIPNDYSGNSTTCAQAAQVMNQIKDSQFAALPIPSNATLVSTTAVDLVNDQKVGVAMRNIWATATLVAPFVWFLSEMICVLLPRLYNERVGAGKGNPCMKLVVLILCFLLSMAANFMLIVNATVQWHEGLGHFAAMMTTPELIIHAIAAAIIVAAFALMLLLLVGKGLGTCCFQRCPCFCRCFLGASDEEAALQGLIVRVTLIGAIVTVFGLLLKIVVMVSISDQYIDDFNALPGLFANLTDWSPTNFLDRPGPSTDFVGDYLVYQRRERPHASSMMTAYANTRDATSVFLAIEVFLTFVAMGTNICAILFSCCLGCCRKAHAGPSYRV